MTQTVGEKIVGIERDVEGVKDDVNDIKAELRDIKADLKTHGLHIKWIHGVGVGISLIVGLMIGRIKEALGL